MKRGTIFIVLFILIAAGVIGASRFLGSQPPLEFTVAVDPLAEAWVQDAVSALNATQPLAQTRRIRFVVSPVDDMDVWQGRANWTNDRHPVAWIAASSASVQYAIADGLPLEVTAASLARTPLVWGGYTSRIDALTQGAPLDWELVAKAAKAGSWTQLGGQAGWGFVDLAFAQPDRKIGGLAALLSGAGSFQQTTTLNGSSLRSPDFRAWMLPVIKSVPSFTTLGSDPAAALTRGPSVGEIALLPEVQWINNLDGFNGGEAIRLSYPAYQFMLDFPLARWNAAQVTSEESAAAAALSNWLSAAAQQANVPNFGLRPAASEPTQADAKFTAGQEVGLLLTPNYGQAVAAPPLADVQGLVQWFVSNQ